MPEAAKHENEFTRLNALRRLGILDTPKEDSYDNIARLAAELCGTPIGIISLVDEDRQWFKAMVGLDVRQTPRCQAFCAHAINLPEALVVPDATKDQRFVDNALVNGEPHIRFYAGIPLFTAADKMPVGTLCVMSDQVMTLDDRQLKALSVLAAHAESLLQLRESNLQLAQRDMLLDTSHDAIFSWTEEEGVLSWNRGAERTFGFTRNEALGRRPYELLKTHDALTGKAPDTLSEGKEWVGELVHQSKAGDPIIVSTRRQSISMGTGNMFLETSRDISKSKESDRTLLRTQAALDTAAEAVFWVKPGGHIFYVNDAACRSLQYTMEELQTMHVTDIDPDMKVPAALDKVASFVEKHQSATFQTTHQRKDGTTFPVEVSSRLIEFRDDVFACTIVRDISDRLAEKRKLESLTAEFQRIFDALPVGVVTTNTQRVITRVNPAFEKMFGYEAKDLLGKTGKSLYGDAGQFDANSQFDMTGRRNHNLEAAAGVPFEMNLRRRNGETFTAKNIGTEFRNASGDVVGFVGIVQDISDSVAARREMEQLSEDRRAMLELLGTTDGVWSWQVGTDTCEYTPGFRSILGFEGDDVRAFPNSLEAFNERVHPDDVAELWRVTNESLAKREPYFHEYRLRHTDNTYIWVRARANSIYSETGEPIKMVGSIYDISSQKEAEIDREHFFNAGIQLYGVADLATATWLRLSDSWADVLGFQVQELLKMPFLESAHPEDREAIIARMRQLKDGVPVRGFLGRMQHKDGSYRWINWNASHPTPGESAVFFTAVDVTDADHDVLRKIADAVPMTLYVLDIKEQRNVFVNRHVKTLLGYTSAEAMALGDNFVQKLMHPDDVPRIVEHFEQISRGTDDQRFDIEYRMAHKSGHFRQIYSTNRIFKRSPDGSVQQIIGTAAPLDDLAILRRYASELEAANEELEEFAYIASHDLKQPLRGIDNLARWIEIDGGEALPAVVREHLAKLKGRVARMESLLDDLLAYSRIGRTTSSVVEFDVGQLVDGVVELLAPPKGFRIECRGPMPVMTTERIPLEQVFRNLIGNAIKHRQRDDGCATISAKQIGQFMEFTVCDDGPGIAPEYHDRVFRMFHTLRPRDEVEASGMGLALAKKQIESHGGEITLDSVEGQGTEFRFTWPI